MGSYEFFVRGPLPGFNDIIAAAKGTGGKGYKYAAMKAAWTSVVYYSVKTVRRPLFQKVRLKFEWHEETRRRDFDNVAAAKKFVIDGLVKAGAIPGDGWSNVIGCSDTVILKNPGGVKVTVEEATE